MQIFFYFSDSFGDSIGANVDVHLDRSLVRNMLSVALRVHQCSCYRLHSIYLGYGFIIGLAISDRRNILQLLLNLTIICIFTDIPEIVFLTTKKKELRFGVDLFTQCVSTWETETEKLFYIARFVLLYM